MSLACLSQTRTNVVAKSNDTIKLNIVLQSKADSGVSANSEVEVLKTWAPYVAAGVALISAVAAAYYSLRRGRMDARFSFASEIHEYRLKQMTEFYAPARLLIEQSKLVYDKLIWIMKHEDPAFKKEDFMLLDHIYKLNSNPKFQPIIIELLSIGEQLSRLISDKAGYIEGEITKPFIDYQGHIVILRAASKQDLQEISQKGWHQLGYFPREVNKEILDGYNKVLIHIQNYSKAGDQIINGLLQPSFWSRLSKR